MMDNITRREFMRSCVAGAAGFYGVGNSFDSVGIKRGMDCVKFEEEYGFSEARFGGGTCSGLTPYFPATPMTLQGGVE